MNYTVLGRTGVSVSTLCMGTMSFGGTADKAESAAMYRSCRNAGINFFDCANVYNEGRSEAILGDLIHHERNEVVITSKFSFRNHPGVNGIGSSRRNAVMEVENSLRRLKTDWIDVYFIHTFDTATAIEETLRALDDLIRDGKILYAGVSNWAAWQIMKALGISEHYGWNRFSCIQPMYNLVKRQAEVEIFPLARAEDLGVISYSPLAGGLLTRRYDWDEEPKEGRFAEVNRYLLRYRDRMRFDAAGAFIDLAESRKVAPATLGVAWTAANPAVTAPIIGARDNNQLQDSLAAAGFKMDPNLYAEIGSLFPPPPPATDRSEEAQDGYGLRD